MLKQARGKPDQTRSIPRKGYICRTSLREMGAGQKGGEPIVAKGKYQRWLEPDGLLLLEGWARDGLTVEQIAHNMGITAKTLYEWKNAHSEICEALKKGKEVVDYQVENALLASALDGNTTAQIFWLKNRRPDRWRDKPIEKTSEDMEVKVVIDV